jgi:hypothetical protein
MVQDFIAYAIVAVAAAWVVWSVFLPRKLKARLIPRRRGKLPQPAPRRRR